MATINDVAALAGVSPTTAKRALRDPERLAPGTLQRVLQAVESLQYEPDQRAGALRGGRNQTVGLLLGSIVEPFFASLARVIGDTLRQDDYTVLIADSEYNSELELRSLKQFLGHRVSGLIIRPGYGRSNLDYLKRMQNHGTYVVEIDHRMPDSPFSSIMLDNLNCIREGVRYLHDLGHRRIAALGTYDALVHPENRSFAFPIAMQEVGLAVLDEYRRLISLTEDEAYEFTRDLMRLEQRPTAVFALNGTGTEGAFRAISELGLRIPDDVSLLGFDNYTWTRLVNPQIDVIAQPTEDMGRLAAEWVIEAVSGHGPNEVRQRQFPGELLKRGSCAPPRDKARKAG